MVMTGSMVGTPPPSPAPPPRYSTAGSLSAVVFYPSNRHRTRGAMSWDGINRRGPRACHGRLRPLLCTLGLLAPIVWVAPIVGLAGPPGPAPAYTPHAPIQIFSNGDFTAANGVVRGSGTAGDPYMIEGWEIAAASSGIAIRDTDKFFVIRNVYIHGSPMGYSGVWLGFLSNGRVEDSLFTDNWAAAFGNYVTNVTF